MALRVRSSGPSNLNTGVEAVPSSWVCNFVLVVERSLPGSVGSSPQGQFRRKPSVFPLHLPLPAVVEGGGDPR